MVVRYLGFYFKAKNKTYKAVIINLIDDNIRGDFSQLQLIEEKFNKEKV
ncbi:hypothetical protein AVANS14531_01625 [Campylobacter sp. Cr9]|nr:hypothetical protein [Campylobacter sp. Cr9]